MLFADEVNVLLAGPELLHTGEPLRILGLAMVVTSCSHILRFAIMTLHRQSDMLRVDMLAAVVALLAYVTMIPFFSYKGVAWSTLAAELVILIGLGILLASSLNLM